MDVLLVGPSGHGGEEVYVRGISENPPEGVRYRATFTFHHGAPGVSCQVAGEVLLNRLAGRLTIANMGFRALRLRDPLDLVHVHAHPIRLRNLGSTPLVFSEGSSLMVYLADYVGWPRVRLERDARRSRRIYRALGIHDRLLACDRAACVYVFSEWARQVNIEWGVNPSKIKVVYPGFPTPVLGEREPREEFRFLFVGTGFERKGGFEVIEAFASLASEYPHVRLDLVSPDPASPNADPMERSWVSPARQRDALAHLKRLESEGRIRRLGLISRELLYSDHFPEADTVLLPTHAEGFGFTNVEAMSFGVPVITSTVGPMPEVVRHGVDGVLVEPGDVESLADAMRRLVADPELARQMGSSGRAAYLARFTTEHFRHALGDVYREALQR
jgi:glycosyltransferase involved in cell wall biosynthesis